MTSAVITGSASGIGAATALRLAEPGTQLTLHTRHSADRLERAGQAVREKGAEVVTVMGDLAEADTAKRIVAAHLEKFGKLDALVANAGFPLLTSFEDMQAEDLDYAFRGNSQSLFHLVRESLDPMRKSAQGRIVVLSSFTAHVFRTDMPQFPASAASKGALETATRSLVMALAQDGITVNCVVPGYIRKDAGTSDGLDEKTLRDIETRIPLGRLGAPDDVAACICFLTSSEAAYMTGQIIHVNGGLI